jgi:hypothetical protein
MERIVAMARVSRVDQTWSSSCRLGVLTMAVMAAVASTPSSAQAQGLVSDRSMGPTSQLATPGRDGGETPYAPQPGGRGPSRDLPAVNQPGPDHSRPDLSGPDLNASADYYRGYRDALRDSVHLFSQRDRWRRPQRTWASSTDRQTWPRGDERPVWTNQDPNPRAPQRGRQEQAGRSPTTEELRLDRELGRAPRNAMADPSGVAPRATASVARPEPAIGGGRASASARLSEPQREGAAAGLNPQSGPIDPPR